MFSNTTLICLIFFSFQHAQNEKNLQMLHNKIETDVANVRTLFESYKNDVFKYSIGKSQYILAPIYLSF